MAETCELSRMLSYTIRMLEKYRPSVELLEETAELLREMERITLACLEDIMAEGELTDFWNWRNDAKEIYVEKTFGGISGARKEAEAEELIRILSHMQEVVSRGIKKACDMEDGICPTYFTYKVTEFTKDEDGIYPQHFEVQKVPLFLEGPVRFLKLSNSMEVKRNYTAM